MQFPWKIIPQDIIKRYKLEEKRHGEYVYVRIKRGMYGLKQAAKLANDELITHL